MGGCASRPKDLDGAAPEAIPADVPAPSSDAAAVDAVETTETVVEENNENAEEIKTDEKPSVVEVSEPKAEEVAPATTSAGDDEEKTIEETKVVKAEEEEEEKIVLSEEQVNESL